MEATKSGSRGPAWGFRSLTTESRGASAEMPSTIESHCVTARGATAAGATGSCAAAGDAA
jgi:hypothetical protein